jgi:long-chain acyl-CoA synthetase
MYQTDQLITFWAQIKPKELAFVDEEHEVTFADLDLFTRKIAQVLNQRGIKQGEVVAIILPSYLAWLFTFSLYRLGIATVAQNNLKAFTSQVKPDWVITLELHTDLAPEKTVMVTEELLELINSTPGMKKLPGFRSPDELATFFQTSGTTGEPKHIAETAEELRSFSFRAGWNDSFGEAEILNLFNVGAAWASRHAFKSLILGKTYYSCIFSDERLVKFISKYPIRTLIGSPLQISAFLEAHEKTAIKLPLLRTICMGGSSPSLKFIDRIKSQLDCKIFNTYGSVEAGFVGVCEAQGQDAYTFSIRPPVLLQIVDESDQVVPEGTIGIVRYQRPDMASSYYKNPEISAQFFKDGFFYPGDRGYLDPQGRLVLEGRTNEIINIGGAKLNPEAIDRIALAQPGVIDCAAFSIAGPLGVDQLAIALVTEGNFDPDIFTTAMATLAPYRIASIFPVASIDRNENGKILRSALSQQYLEQKGQDN